MTKQIVNIKLIIWDEAPMIKDVLWSPNLDIDEQPFGGKVVIFS